MEKSSIKLRPTTQEELNAFNTDLQEILKKHSIHLAVNPLIREGLVTGEIVALKVEDDTKAEENSESK